LLDDLNQGAGGLKPRAFQNFSRSRDMKAFRTRGSSASALLIVTLMLAACSGEPNSLADYIAALCTTPIQSGSPDEEPFLAENVSAMTK
jgi:hypothetical protein